MPKKSTKSVSKRIKLADKYRVEKRVKAHHKKLKKEAKKNPQWRSKIKKDPGIPNLHPYKEKLMSMMKESHEAEEKGKERQRRELRGMKDLAAKAASTSAAYEKKQQQQSTSEPDRMIPRTERESSKKAFFKEFKKVVDDSDVILEVLDARDPLGCRAREVEKEILQRGNKKIILVLNKIDLVPREVVAAWLKALRNEFPTVAFRCNTQTQKSHLQRNKGDFDTYDSLEGGSCLGGDNLMELLKNYCRSLNLKKSITVGIIGFPNTGKSSLINSLKRTKAAAVGAKPGFTRVMKEVKLDANVVLLDCPGIVFSAGADDYSSADVVLRNAVEVEKIPDPELVVEAVLKRCVRERLMELYEIPAYKTSEQFLAFVAQKKRKLKKGGVPDLSAAAVSVLRDWQSGKIKFYTLPPENLESVVSSEIVTQWAKEFDLDAVVQREEESVVRQLPSLKGMSETILVQSSGARSAFVGNEDDLMDENEEEKEEEEEDEEVYAGADMMELSEEEEDAFAVADKRKGAMVMEVKKKEQKKEPKVSLKRFEQQDMEDYVAPETKSQKKKKLKKQKKHAMDVEYTSEPFDFNDFVAVEESTRAPEEDDEDEQEEDFRY